MYSVTWFVLRTVKRRYWAIFATIFCIFISSRHLCALLIQRNGTMSLNTIGAGGGYHVSLLASRVVFEIPTAHPKWHFVREHIDTLVEENIIVDKGVNADGHRILTTPEPNTRSYQQLTVLANSSWAKSRALLYGTCAAESARLRQTHQRSSWLIWVICSVSVYPCYMKMICQIFDRALFTSFMDALERLGYITVSASGWLIWCAHSYHGKSARFILNMDVMHILQQISQLTDEEIKRTLTELQNKKQTQI